jgi:hypothetical protein
LRLSLRAKEGLAIAIFVGLAVAIATLAHLATVARLGTEEAAARGSLLAQQTFFQASRALRGERGSPADVLRRGSGMRAFLDSMVGYSPTVVYGAITDPANRVIVHSDPAQAGRLLPTRESADAAAQQNALALLRTLAGPPRVFEAQIPLTLGQDPLGRIRVGISTSLLRREVASALTRSLRCRRRPLPSPWRPAWR